MQKSKSYYWIAFMLQPFFTLLFYLKHFKSSDTKNVLWLFTIYFGATIAIGRESLGSDIVVYMNDIQIMQNINDFDGVYNYYQNSKEVDVFRIFFAFLISRFTDNGYIYLIFLSIVFGFFYSRTICLVLDKITKKNNLNFIILLFCLFLVIPIWYLGGFRFWTASYVFLFGLLGYIIKGKKKYLIWFFLTPIIFHYAFIVPCSMVIIYLLFGNRLSIYFYAFILSIALGEINLSSFNTYIDTFAPQGIVDRSSSYRSEDKVEEYRNKSGQENIVWYAKYKKYFIQWPIYFLLVYIYMCYRKKIKDKVLFNLFNFTFLFYSFANIFASLPSGSRYLYISAFIGLSFIILFIQFNNVLTDKTFNKTFKYCLPLLVIFILVQIREAFYLTSLFTIIGNPFTAIFLIGDNISLNDLIK